MFDWQTAIVALIIFAAAAYVARRGWARLRSFTARGGSGASSCASGCGSCGRGERPTLTPPPGSVLVQIGRQSSHARRTHRQKNL